MITFLFGQTYKDIHIVTRIVTPCAVILMICLMRRILRHPRRRGSDISRPISIWTSYEVQSSSLYGTGAKRFEDNYIGSPSVTDSVPGTDGA